MTRPIGCRHDGTWDPANALADTIRDAVAALHPAGAHAQSTGGVHHRGVRDTVTVATLDVRVGEWSTSARGECGGVDPECALAFMRQRLRARLVRDMARHSASLRACEAALEVLDHDGGAR